jgi:glutamate dehydrogenase
VAALVLADNAAQALALTLDGARSARDYERHVEVIDELVESGGLSRADESVPSRADLLASPHRERGLPRPLLAVLLGYTKMHAYAELVEGDFPESVAGRPFLEAYFPQRLRRAFAAHFDGHVLRREIVATAAVNHVVNHAGIAFLRRAGGAADGPGPAVAAWLAADQALGGAALREAARAGPRPAAEEQALLLEIEDGVASAARLRLEGAPGPAADPLAALRARLGAGPRA